MQVELDKPLRIDGDVLIRFCGEGRARFRLQHAADRDGAPDDLGWCDISAVSDRRVMPEAAIDRENGVRAVLLDQVDGEATVAYRRFAADWLRVVPHYDDEEAREQCSKYRISMEPVP
jgi:hypothetical protein